MKSTAWMNQDGVGCESCHGSAEKWLGTHTTEGWKGISRREKEEQYGLIDIGHLARRVELCAGCHVGRRAGENGDFPPQDVNHDLVAAGHPRLNFEFASFQANQPRHWKAGGAESAPDFPARAWAIGQLITAKIALELLRERAAGAALAEVPARPAPLPPAVSAAVPWPEFTEYDCFSCHHSLRDESWRRERRPSGAPLGAPAWGSWYYPLTSALLETPALGAIANSQGFRDVFEPLVREMSRPTPNAGAVRDMAAKAIKALERPIATLGTRGGGATPFNASKVEQLIGAFDSREHWGGVASWDHAAQRYLALVPLNQARAKLNPGRAKEQQALDAKLHALFGKLSFPKGVDSPRGFDPARLPAGP
jgi:hypothetical protein